MKTTKKSPKASHKKAVKDLEVKPAKGGAVRGGDEIPMERKLVGSQSFQWGVGRGIGKV
jgi:hypothetical protein